MKKATGIKKKITKLEAKSKEVMAKKKAFTEANNVKKALVNKLESVKKNDPPRKKLLLIDALNNSKKLAEISKNELDKSIKELAEIRNETLNQSANKSKHQASVNAHTTEQEGM